MYLSPWHHGLTPEPWREGVQTVSTWHAGDLRHQLSCCGPERGFLLNEPTPCTAAAHRGQQGSLVGGLTAVLAGLQAWWGGTEEGCGGSHVPGTPPGTVGLPVCLWGRGGRVLPGKWVSHLGK